MMTQNADKKREQMLMFCMDDLVPQDHLLRIIDKAIDWNFIYGLVENKYSPDFGRPSMDPVMLIKIPLIQYLYGIKSMRQTIKEIEVNVAYRWFLGLEMLDKVPHFSTFGKNYTRRFKDTDLFEQIFTHILSECYRFKLVDPSEIFVDATHVKARANNKKMQKRIAREEALFYEEMLKKEINTDREEHGKKALKENKYTEDGVLLVRKQEQGKAGALGLLSGYRGLWFQCSEKNSDWQYLQMVLGALGCSIFLICFPWCVEIIASKRRVMWISYYEQSPYRKRIRIGKCSANFIVLHQITDIYGKVPK